MRQMEFNSLYDTILAIRNWKGFRLLYMGGRLEEMNFLLSYGENGVLTLRDILISFYNNYLKGIPIFDGTFKHLTEQFSKFDPEDLIRQKFSSTKYKQVVLSICDKLDEFEIQLKKYFQINSIFQIWNSTFQTDTLFYYVGSFYSPQVWAFIPDSSKLDIAEGARCILFACPTSAVFMILRALEGCLRKLYEKIVRKPPPQKHTMGQILKELKEEFKKQDNGDAVEHIGFLCYIKDQYRNPSAHPGVHFDKGQAEKLFQMANVGIEKVCQMHA